MRLPPHLPFMAGPPDFTVGLRPIETQAWITPDVEAAALPEKRALIATRLDEVYAATPDSHEAQAELARLVGAARAASADTLVEAAQLTSDDLVVLLPDAAGAWRVRAALLCAPTYFSCHDALGKTLHGLHAPVPDRLADGAQGLGDRIGRVFDGLRPDLVLERFNWTVQAGPDRFTPSSAPVMARAAVAEPSRALDELFLRVERQTIRKLAATGAVVFTIRISLDPLATVFAVAGAKNAFATAWAQAPDYVRGYKRWPALDRLVMAALAAAP